MSLTDADYLRAIDLCRRVVDAHDSDDGGPTVAGSVLGQLRTLLNARRDDPEFCPHGERIDSRDPCPDLNM